MSRPFRMHPPSPSSLSSHKEPPSKVPLTSFPPLSHASGVFEAGDDFIFRNRLNATLNRVKDAQSDLAQGNGVEAQHRPRLSNIPMEGLFPETILKKLSESVRIASLFSSD